MKQLQLIKCLVKIGRNTGQQIAELIWPLDVVYLMIKISDSLFSFKIPEIDLRLGHLEDS